MPHSILHHDRPRAARALQAQARVMRSQWILWRELKARRLGYAFERDHAIDRYKLPFYCEALKLAVEVDGIVRDDLRILQRCRRRHARLGRLGVAVLYFTDEEVTHNIDGVMSCIRRWIRQRPAASREGGAASVRQLAQDARQRPCAVSV